jgi:CheY-like chemotaxis protein
MSQANLNVLLIEDEVVVAMLLEDMLSDLGHHVIAAASRLDEAMKCAAELTFDLAIVDLNLNGERSDQLAKLLSSRGIPFVLATGYGEAELEEHWKGMPALQKPFQLEELSKAISVATRGPNG